MSNQALEKIDPGALAALMTPEEIENFNADFSAGVAAEFLPQLSIRGGKFRLKIGGQEEILPERSIDVHFIGARGAISKTYYKGGYDPKAEQKAPDCSSIDSQYPDSNIKDPQAANCQICDYNAWGSAKGESKGKACSDYKQIVVSLAVAPEVAFGLRIPPTSFKPFGSYLQKLKMANAPANAAITRMTLGDEEYPTLSFDFAGLVDRGTFEKIKAVAGSAEVQQVIQIQPRALKAAEPVSAQQPVVVETVTLPVAELESAVEQATQNVQPDSSALAALLAKNKPAEKKTRAKKEKPVVEDEAIVEAPAALITDVNALLKKMQEKG